MTVVVCLDERGGMVFNRRRQSRDRVLIDDLVKMSEGKVLYIAEYSKPLFEAHAGSFTVAEDMLQIAERNDFCFLELGELAPVAERIERLVIYHWNRHYPSDTYLDVTPESLGMRLCESTEFKGSSHEKISKEIYVK